jgi:NDP-sugar pyrophosphorylase family protein
MMQGVFGTPLRGMVLCAGMGSRLGELGEEVPKPLLPVCNHPLLSFGMSLLRGFGITEIGVNLHHLADRITSALGDGRDYGVDINYSIEPELLGTGGGLRKLAKFLTYDGREPCVAVNGKLLIDVDLEAVLALHRVTGATATMVLRETPDADAWGAVEVDHDGRVHRLLGQTAPIPPPTGSLSRCMYTGVQIIEPQLLARLPEGQPSCVVRQGYIPALRAGEILSGYIIPGYFYEHSTPERYLQGNLNALRGLAKLSYPPGPLQGISPRAQVSPRATVHGAVCIGAGAVIDDGAIIGPDVVLGEGARVERGVHLERAVVFSGAHVRKSVYSGVVTNKAIYPIDLGALGDRGESPHSV